MTNDISTRSGGGRRLRGNSQVIVKAVLESEAAQEERRTGLLDVTVSELPDARQFVVTAPIAAPAATAYALVDWADERNKYRQMGDEVAALDDEERRFRLVVRFMPNLRFDYEVEEASKPEVYAYTCVTTPPVGHLLRSHEHFRFDAVGEEGCVVTFTLTAYFESGLNETQSEEATHMMTVACHNAIAKLKANAEHGVGTVEAFEATHLMPL